MYRFKKLDTDSSGSISVEEFMSLPELQQNPLVQIVIGKFDRGLDIGAVMKSILRHL